MIVPQHKKKSDESSENQRLIYHLHPGTGWIQTVNSLYQYVSVRSLVKSILEFGLVLLVGAPYLVIELTGIYITSPPVQHNFLFIRPKGETQSNIVWTAMSSEVIERGIISGRMPDEKDVSVS